MTLWSCWEKMELDMRKTRLPFGNVGGNGNRRFS